MERLCHIDDLADCAARGFPASDGGTPALFVVRRGAQMFVYWNDCPHEHGPMAWRKDEYLNSARTRIVCWAHGAEFEIDTGLCLAGPCKGAFLRRAPHILDADGWILVRNGESGGSGQ